MRLVPGQVLDGFEVLQQVHHGAMAHLYSVRYASAPPAVAHNPGFEMLMKVPRMAPGDGAENIVGFEVEQQILQALEGPHVPRLVAVGDLDRQPFLVMEYLAGQTVQHWQLPPGRSPVDAVAELGAATARALHSLHQQNVCHMDLKPANVLIRPDGTAVLLDFGLSCHAHYPDLLAEEMRDAIGSPPWIAPEQVVGVRGDPRSDLFALGVMLYELATGQLPFGSPQTVGGMRQRLWMDPVAPRALRPELPAWLQEVILRCLEPVATLRYPSAAHLAFDLAHPEHVALTTRAHKTGRTGLGVQFKRWLGALGGAYQPSPKPAQLVNEVPIVLVAVPPSQVSDATLYALRQAAQRSLGALPGARLVCVTVIDPGQLSTVQEQHSEINVHRRHLEALRRWAAPLVLDDQHVSFHVLESTDVAQALLSYAAFNHVSMMVLGAATHAHPWQGWVPTVPIQVAMSATCTVVLVKSFVPFDHLA